jgi:hypothetical protein
MNIVFIILILPFSLYGRVSSESFIIQIKDRSMAVTSPDKSRMMFSVIVENKSLSDQIGKFTAGNKILKFISIQSGKSEVVEIENKSKAEVLFVPVSPAFQEVPLLFGKKAYEIPSKK